MVMPLVLCRMYAVLLRYLIQSHYSLFRPPAPASRAPRHFDIGKINFNFFPRSWRFNHDSRTWRLVSSTCLGPGTPENRKGCVSGVAAWVRTDSFFLATIPEIPVSGTCGLGRVLEYSTIPAAYCSYGSYSSSQLGLAEDL